MGGLYLGLLMSLVAVLCLVSSFRNSSKVMIGYKGLYLFIRNKKKRNALFRISNRIYAALLLVGSVAFTLMPFIAYGNNNFNKTLKVSCIIYIVLIGIIADILTFTIIEK